MKSIKIFILILVLTIWIIWSCDSPNDSTDNTVILGGQVVNAETNYPIANALVALLDSTLQISTRTGADGIFSLQFETEESFQSNLIAFSEGYIPDTITVAIVPGQSVTGLSFRLYPTGSAVVPSGSAASIILGGVDPSSIGVRESGAPEVAEISFVVQDSTGIPVDLFHSVTVNFILGSSPGGGEFVHPVSAVTGVNGIAKTNIFSGTRAGVVQIIAEIVEGTTILRSQPVAVAIHGGLPDSTHFSLAVEKVNFPGFNIYGLTDGITAYVGDKYANPVKENTAVYFTTTGGLIEGSAFTDLMGQASVNLLSAAPQPIHPIYGAGFATVTGRTADENRNMIETDIIVLFSGYPVIQMITTDPINVPNGGSQYFNYYVGDQNNNPLAEGTSINVSVQEGDVKASGNTNVNLPDTQSPAWTHFAFVLTDSKPDSLSPNPVTIKISTSGPNGSLEVIRTGMAE